MSESQHHVGDIVQITFPAGSCQALVEIAAGEPMPPEYLAAVRSDGLTFLACVEATAVNAELVAEFDRLQHTNLSRHGAPLELAIDDATGRTSEEIAGFLRFVWNCVFIRCAPITQP
jgi:hypothetical protein